MPGSTRLCMYSARPVTLEGDSTRGRDFLRCFHSAVSVFRSVSFMASLVGRIHCRAHRAAQVDAQQMFLVVGRSVLVANNVQGGRGRQACLLESVVGRYSACAPAFGLPQAGGAISRRANDYAG